MTERTVALVGALDTKGEEYKYLREKLCEQGIGSITIDTGILGTATIAAEISREVVAKAAGVRISALIEHHNRDHAIRAMATGARSVVSDLLARGKISGLFIMGGSNAGYVMSVLISVLPFGLPKLLLSTIVSGDTRPYVGGSDLTMMYPVEDIAGINSVSRSVIDRAAGALVGMINQPTIKLNSSATLIGLSMFGVTTACVTKVAAKIRAHGAEPHIFHATGTGGLSLESIIAGNQLSGVADLTTTELADELVGGVCTAGPERLTAAARTGIPQVISSGALDMVNFGPRDSVPIQFRNRKLHAHNPTVTLMRTSPDENAQLGTIIAQKLQNATAPVELHIPARGFSQISMPGEIFHDPVADHAFIAAVQRDMRPDIPVFIHDLGINDQEFASIVYAALERILTLGKRNQ